MKMFGSELGKLDPSDPSGGFIEVILTWLSLTVSSCSSRHPAARLLSLCLFFFTSSNCSGWDGVCLRAYSGGSRPPGPPPPRPRACPPSSPARCTGTARPASSARRTAGDSPSAAVEHQTRRWYYRFHALSVMTTDFVDFSLNQWIVEQLADDDHLKEPLHVRLLCRLKSPL